MNKLTYEMNVCKEVFEIGEDRHGISSKLCFHHFHYMIRFKILYLILFNIFTFIFIISLNYLFKMFLYSLLLIICFFLFVKGKQIPK